MAIGIFPFAVGAALISLIVATPLESATVALTTFGFLLIAYFFAAMKLVRYFQRNRFRH